MSVVYNLITVMYSTQSLLMAFMR